MSNNSGDDWGDPLIAESGLTLSQPVEVTEDVDIDVDIEPDLDPTPVAPAAPEPAVAPAQRRLFSSDGALRLAIVGGKGSGKSYLFQSMVYRLRNPKRAGALTPFLKDAQVSALRSKEYEGEVDGYNLHKILEDFERWRQLAFTTATNQLWYKLRIEARTGWLGRNRLNIDVDYFDASGEVQAMEQLGDEMSRVWRIYATADVAVFCLPAWAAFPYGPALNEDVEAEDIFAAPSWTRIEQARTQFFRVVEHFKRFREEAGRRDPVHTVLALTMADDRTSALAAVRERWIEPFTDPRMSHPNRERLAQRGGVSRYLDNARRVSDAVRAEFESASSAGVSNIPNMLDMGHPPWIIPTSAMDGEVLKREYQRRERVREQVKQEVSEAEFDDAFEREDRKTQHRTEPSPAHVELPLLLALCGRYNVLM